MAYTPILSVADVQAHYPAIEFSGSTTPTLRQVSVWCVEATAIIYARLATSYVIPVTNADDLTVLKAIARYYVLPRIDKILSKSTVTKSKSSSKEESPAETFSRMLEEVAEGTLLLINSTRESTYKGGYSYTQENSITPKSSKEDDIW